MGVIAVARATDRRALPAVLASPMLADRLAVELTTAAEAVQGEDAMSRERRGFLAAAAVQVESFGSNAVAERDAAEPDVHYRPRAVPTGVDLPDESTG